MALILGVTNIEIWTKFKLKKNISEKEADEGHPFGAAFWRLVAMESSAECAAI